MKRIFLTLMLTLTMTLLVKAQVQVSVQAPSEVIEGDRFRVSYVVNTQDIQDFKVEEFKGLVELYGPSQSSSSSYSIVNGRTTSSSTITFTYTVTSDKAGTFTLPVASVVSDGKTYKSSAKSITVLPAGSGGGSQGGNGGNANAQGRSNSNSTRMHTSEVGERISGKDIFIAVTASKKRVYEQEAVLLTYKLYTLVNVSEMSGKMPELDGFHVQQLNREQQPQLKMEHYNGKNYGTVIWCQYVVFPQHSGQLTIPEIKFDATIIQQDRSVDPFEAFFGGGSMMREVHKAVIAPAVTLNVDALPTPKPANFSGAVGKFTLTSSLTPLELKANDATTMRVTVKGTGNMKLMKAPEVQWPKDFEKYDPKMEDKTSIGASGSTGTVLFDFIAVPRHQGKYDVPAVEFCYFDPDAKSYKTIRGEAFSMDVAKGKEGPRTDNGLSKEEIELLNNDIHYIKTGDVSYQTGSSSFFNSNRYWLVYVLSLLMFAILVFLFRHQAAVNADTARKRGKGASKVAAKRLKAANKLLAQNDANAFYEETMKALWGYISDKENIPLSELNKDNVRERLTSCQVAPELIDAFLATLDSCEFARFAPGDPAENMEKIYASAEDVINRMENDLKKK